MSDETLIQLPDGSRWKPATSSDIVHCESCGNAVDTPEEVLSYPHGKCPECGNGWTGSERRSTSITVTAPEAVKGIA
jgi:predicted RNA-binding Zn-ribbon protein involved in translation (DUF1610 family)